MPLANEHAGFTCSVRGVNLNAIGDTPVHAPFAKYIVRRMTCTNSSADLSSSLARIGAYTGAGASGTAVVTPATATELSAPTKFGDRTIAVVADTLTASTLYVRVGVAHGSAATCDVYFELQSLE